MKQERGGKCTKGSRDLRYRTHKGSYKLRGPRFGLGLKKTSCKVLKSLWVWRAVTLLLLSSPKLITVTGGLPSIVYCQPACLRKWSEKSLNMFFFLLHVNNSSPCKNAKQLFHTPSATDSIQSSPTTNGKLVA